MDGIKTAYSTAYNRLLLLVKSGKIGNVVSVDATCTSQKNYDSNDPWDSICAWGPTAMMPVFQILGTKYKKRTIASQVINESKKIHGFTKIDFVYDNAVASIKVAKTAKSEGELIITGTKGYIFVPAPWWKTEYFEVRYENPENNRRYFYQLDGEGIRYEIVAFLNEISSGKASGYISSEVSREIVNVIEDCKNNNCLNSIIRF